MKKCPRCGETAKLAYSPTLRVWMCITCADEGYLVEWEAE